MTISRRQKANAIRALSMDAVQQARSGHPGAPMGMADIAEVLWSDFLAHNPGNPAWVDRDRFVLSNGHGSMLLYSLLHLTGYDLPIEQLKQFRQLHSRTPGHPERGCTPGAETTTGPLGQGLANAVGMALAERALAAQFNRPDHEIVNHYTYVFVGDGCLMEGISHEACSLAGTLGLGKLIVVYDDNRISIDGDVRGWFTDDTPMRFRAYGWHVVPDVDGHDPEAVAAAIRDARAETRQPTLICCRTLIGWGAPHKQGTEACHGAPLGDQEVTAAREYMGWPHPPFEIPDEIYATWDAQARGVERETFWREGFDRYRAAHPGLAAEFERRLAGTLPEDWELSSRSFIAEVDRNGQSPATRKASQQALEGYGPLLPELIGGSADLTDSNLTRWSGSTTSSRDDPGGNYVHFGVREFAMAAITNGIALHGGFKPYCATFLVFSEYARNALRLASLMKLPCVFLFTHDSVGLGEDGPTHQPVEQAATLRLMPNMAVWRPCDAVETAVAWKAAIDSREGPSCLLLTRQGVPHQPRSADQIAGIQRGAYILRDAAPDELQAIVIATGSEVALAVEAAAVLAKRGCRVRVVSMPSAEVFEAQDPAYRESVLPASVKARVAVEAGVSDWWRKYVGLDGRVVGIDDFGESAPAPEVFQYFGLSVDSVVRAVENLANEPALATARY